MNRRSFLSSLLGGIATAAVAPQIVTHGLKLKKQGSLWVPNPDYVHADYGVYFLLGGENLQMLLPTPPVRLGEIIFEQHWDGTVLERKIN